MASKLFGLDVSPPVRSVLLTAAVLDLKLDYVEINVLAKEHLTPEFLKMNPQHTVPTLVDDDGTCIWDSHAICTYLTAKYGKDESLYPQDIIKRASIDQRLHFDSSVVFPALYYALKPVFYFESKEITKESLEKFIEAYTFLDAFLSDNLWMAGKCLTLADLCLIPSVTSSNCVVPVDFEKFPKLHAWIRRAEELPCYDLNRKGLNDFKDLLDTKLNS